MCIVPALKTFFFNSNTEPVHLITGFTTVVFGLIVIVDQPIAGISYEGFVVGVVFITSVWA